MCCGTPLVADYRATGLTAGAAYTFAVNTTGMASTPITWAGATRSATVRIFETADPSATDYSGLSLIVGSVKAYSAGHSSLDLAKIDMVLYTDPSSASTLTLVSAGASGSGIQPSMPGVRMCSFNDNSVLVAGGLDNDYYSSDLKGLFSVPVNNAADIPAGVSSELIVRVVTSDKNYTRVEVMKQSDGTLIGGTTGSRYIDVTVSEQATASLPYAARGIDASRFFATTRKAGIVNMH